MINKLIVLSLLLGLCGQNLMAQQAMVPAGGDAIGGSGSASYTIGQVAYSSADNRIGNISEGVQQPITAEIITSTKTGDQFELQLNTYPNPTSGLVTIATSEIPSENIQFQVTDLAGKTMVMGQITSLTTSLDFSSYTPGQYIVSIRSNQQTIKTVKIIKN